MTDRPDGTLSPAEIQRALQPARVGDTVSVRRTVGGRLRPALDVTFEGRVTGRQGGAVTLDGQLHAPALDDPADQVVAGTTTITPATAGVTAITVHPRQGGA